MSNTNSIWGRRLKEARLLAGLSQKQLGIQAGLDEFIASPRINRYELGVHKADYQIVQKLAQVLDVPTGYFYTEDDSLAEIMITFHRLSNKKKSELLKTIKKVFSS